MVISEAFSVKHVLFDLTDIKFDAYLHDIERTVRIIRITNDEIGAMVAPNTHENSTTVEINLSSDHSYTYE